jgi:hypothetical protein
MNSLRMKERSRGCPQGSCCSPGFWNLQFNLLLELKFMAQTKVVAFADNLIMATRGDSVGVVENYVNVELSKINGWSKKKIKFNEKNQK